MAVAGCCAGPGRCYGGVMGLPVVLIFACMGPMTLLLMSEI